MATKAMAAEAIRRRLGRKRDEAGLSTVEVVIGTPVLFMFVVAMVALGFYAQNVAQVQNAAQDAARMGSLQRSLTDAWNDAEKAAKADLAGICNDSPGGEPQILNPPTVTVDADNVTLLTVTVECQFTEFGLSHIVDESATAPVDTYRGGPL